LKALQYAAEVSACNKGLFNEDLILNLRKNDDMVKYIDETWQELVRHIPNNIRYLGYTYDDTKRRTRELNIGNTKKKKSPTRTMSIYDTYARTVIFQFQATIKNSETGEDETQFIETPIHIPLYVDNYHFFIRGNKYSAPFQVVDSIVYSSKNNIIVLKTMTRAIKMTREKHTNMKDVFGNKYITYNFYIYMNSKKVSFLLYYLSYYGFTGTLRYFGAEEFIKVYSAPPINDQVDHDRIYFQFCSIYLGVDRKAFETIFNLRQFVSSLLDVQKRSLDAEDISTTSRWLTILGSSISETNALIKGEKLLRTFIISLDARTIINIKKLIGGSSKENMHSVVRWMFIKFGELSSKTNSLLNKRIRLSEYLIDPFLKETYKKLYRFLSTDEKSRDMSRLVDILKINPGIIVGAISGKNKQSLNLNIAKYSSSVNDNVLLSDALRFTSSGPGTPTSGGGSLSTQFRIFDISYSGRIDLHCSSNSDPGVSGMFIPSTKINIDSFTFAKDQINGDGGTK
jgi:hypothetical protein